MQGFESVYHLLNAAQKQAVDYLDGPLLVIAGPGTGKTQLLSARVANILLKTDTPAQNILCLTFTENGAENMRERLTRFIGSDAYNVNIGTYHAFGRDLIRRFPEQFQELRLENSVDELGQRQIIADIVERMHYANPLKQTRHHLGDLISTISEVKRAMLKTEDLRLIAAENLMFIRHAQRELAPVLGSFTRMPTKALSAIALFEQVRDILAQQAPETPVNTKYKSLAKAAVLSLNIALEEASQDDTTKPLTKWKDSWLVKNASNQLTLDGEDENKRIQALADVMDQYRAALDLRGLYDYDDMIVEAVNVLQHNDEFRFTLQEQYLYILLDELQDTNEAQFKLVEMLTNNPVNEGRPNVMAVGDDDQAIYAFQGALYSNMVDFRNMYQDVQVITLTENYRSHPDIIATAGNVADQISQRLYQQLDGTSKTLVAANSDMPPRADITRREFLSDIAQADWVSRRIKKLVESGVQPIEIAVLAPRHKQLEPLVPYLRRQKLPVRYEKRENILEAEVVKQLLTMCRLVLALHHNDEAAADNLWPQVLSYDFWKLSTSSIWEMAWQVADERKSANENGSQGYVSWSRALLADGKRFRIPALLFLTLANKVAQETGETMLDYLIGSIVIDTNESDLPQIYSPLRDYYTNPDYRRNQPELFYETLSHLTVLRARLREHQQASEAALSLQDLIDFVDMYYEADEQMTNTSPYTQATDAVQVMTVFKAKGLEFEHVILVGLQDEVWGNSSRAQTNRISLPANLIPIRKAGVTEDERLRILYVALTRAKRGLHLTSFTRSYSGKETKRLKYLDEEETENGVIVDRILPDYAQTVQQSDATPPTLDQLELDWRKRHIDALAQIDLRALLEPRLKAYRLSPTHLGQFLDLQYAGPERFFFSTILRFPEAPTADIQFGNAIHETLEWVQHSVRQRGSIPNTPEALEYFVSRMRAKKLTGTRTGLEIERGEAALAAYLAARKSQYKPADRAEVSFYNQGVIVGDTRMSGKVDRLEIDTTNKTITVVDYKTGKGNSKWLQDAKLYKYRRQLYSYKLLVENSISFAGFTVIGGRLEFVEPADDGHINVLNLAFEPQELERVKLLTQAMWKHVHDLNFPNVSAYDASLNGIKQFEQDLIDGTI